MAVLTGRTHGKFVHVGFADEAGAGIEHSPGHGRFVRWDKIRQDAGSTGSSDAAGAEIVLRGKGNAAEIRRLAISQQLVGGFRLLQGTVRGQGDEGIELLLQAAGPFAERLGQLNRTEFPLAQARAQLGNAFAPHHSITLGTRK